jgi:hypothetical protein
MTSGADVRPGSSTVASTARWATPGENGLLALYPRGKVNLGGYLGHIRFPSGPERPGRRLIGLKLAENKPKLGGYKAITPVSGVRAPGGRA